MPKLTSSEFTDKITSLMLINGVDHFSVTSRYIKIRFTQARVNIGIVTQMMDSIESYAMGSPYSLTLYVSLSTKDIVNLRKHPAHVDEKSLFS